MKWYATSVRHTTQPIEILANGNCNDQIAAKAFGCEMHVDPVDYAKLSEADCIFATMWKIHERGFEPRWMDVLHRLKDAGKTVVLFQEAETGWALTRSWEEQKSFIELLGKVDLFLTHNNRDIALWGQLRKGKPTLRWKTCLDLSWAEKLRIDPKDKPTRPILFGSSYDDRANGLTGLIACKDLSRPLWHQNRSTGYEDRNRELPELLGVKIDKEIGHSDWSTWLREISGAYIAVHPMPAAAAGRDQIAFAALGIPCVGNQELDIQLELFGSVGMRTAYDMTDLRIELDWLLHDDDMYMEHRQRAIREVKDYGLTAARIQAAEIKAQMNWGSTGQ